jgi:hypothetical protein
VIPQHRPSAQVTIFNSLISVWRVSGGRKISSGPKKKAVNHREGTIRSKLEEIYKKIGYEDGKKEAIKKGFNRYTVMKQMYLIHTGK